jgi:hypothetical protein
MALQSAVLEAGNQRILKSYAVGAIREPVRMGEEKVLKRFYF